MNYYWCIIGSVDSENLINAKIIIYSGCAFISYHYFYKTSKPYTRWWWFASEIKKEDIRSQYKNPNKCRGISCLPP